MSYARLVELVTDQTLKSVIDIPVVMPLRSLGNHMRKTLVTTLDQTNPFIVYKTILS